MFLVEECYKRFDVPLMIHQTLSLQPLQYERNTGKGYCHGPAPTTVTIIVIVTIILDLDDTWVYRRLLIIGRRCQGHDGCGGHALQLRSMHFEDVGSRRGVSENTTQAEDDDEHPRGLVLQSDSE